MNKSEAEAILGLTDPYDYKTLRDKWKKLTSEFHPDLSARTGMDQDMLNETLTDINEAYSVLKPLVENGETVTPGISTVESDDPAQQSDMQESAYRTALSLMLSATTRQEYLDAAKMFSLLGNYEDSKEKFKQCIDLANASEIPKPTPAVNASVAQEDADMPNSEEQKTKKGRGTVVVIAITVLCLIALTAGLVLYSTGIIGPAKWGDYVTNSSIEKVISNGRGGKATWDKMHEPFTRITFGFGYISSDNTEYWFYENSGGNPSLTLNDLESLGKIALAQMGLTQPQIDKISNDLEKSRQTKDWVDRVKVAEFLRGLNPNEYAEHPIHQESSSTRFEYFGKRYELRCLYQSGTTHHERSVHIDPL